MKITIVTFIICTLFAAAATAQQPQPTTEIKKVPKDAELPVLDGVIDDIWEITDPLPIDRNFQEETPTIGSSTWKALWSDDPDGAGVYILIIVDDDNYWPHYLAGSGSSWEFDKIEIYFDCNLTLDDGGGATGGPANGHHQFAPAFAEGMIDGSMQWGEDGGEPVWYSHMVNDPDYIGEYYVPLELLNNEFASPADLTGELGFDIYILDQDAGVTNAVQRAVWANEGLGDGDEAWIIMDDCGIITFEDAEDPEWIQSIEITPGEINENNGVLKLVATVLPEDYTESFKWELVNFSAGTTGRARFDTKKGELTGVYDGTVTVMATAASGFIGDTIDIVISNQLVSLGDINLIRNGFFERVDEDNFPDEWDGGSSDDGDAYVTEEGYSVHNPAQGGTAPWSYGFNQQNFGCNTTEPYTFSFVAWAEQTRNIMVAFEDPGNNYNRYGTSTSEWALTPDHYWWNSGPGNDPPQDWTGNSMWEIELTTDPMKFEMDVIFDGKDPAGGVPTTENLQFHFGLSDTIVYLDSVVLYNDNDLDLITDYIEVESIEISTEGDATSVDLGGTLQLSAEVLPENAKLTEVNWRVESVDGWATIDEAGLLTADTSGLVKVYASAKDDSGKEDMVEIRVNWPVGISDYTVSPLKIYPNPAVNELTVELGKENAMVSLFNSMGQKLDEVLVSGTEYRFDISRYASGIYYVKSGNSVAKFIK